jgi:type I restriction enzyme S subunit
MNFINAIDFRAAIASLQSGSTRKRISRGNLATLSVPVPPLAEQERLVEKIDELLTKLEAGVAELRKTQAQLKLYRQSVLNAAVKGELTKVWREAHQAELEPASELLARILKERREKWEASQMAKKRAAGKTSTNDDWKMKYRQPEIPRNRELRELPRGWGWVTVEQLNPFDRPCAYGVLQPGGDFENGVLFVRVGDIGEGKIDASKLKRIDPQIARAYPRTRLLGKEVLITLVGAIGRTAVVPRSLAGANTARAVGVIPICENVSSDWAEIWFRNPEKVQEMTNLSHEVARKTLNLEDVRTALVALPSLSEQYMIVSETERLLSVADNIGRTIEQSLKQAERMRQSILKQAFEGRLVPQDQSDEPAGLLLERIKIERAKREVEKSAASKANRGPFKKKQTKRVEGAAA